MYEEDELTAPSGISSEQPSTAAEAPPDHTCADRRPCPILQGDAGLHRLPGAGSCPLLEAGACSPAYSADPSSDDRADEPIGWIDL